MKNIQEKWVKFILWVSAYLTLIGLILVGGYAWINGNDQIKKEMKRIFIVKLIFIGLSVALIIFQNILVISDASFEALRAYSIVASVIGLIEIIVFGVFAILALFNKVKNQGESKVFESKQIKNINQN